MKLRYGTLQATIVAAASFLLPVSLGIVQSLRDSNGLRMEREAFQIATLSLVSDGLREPIIQGSEVEVAQRAATFERLDHVVCVQVQDNSHFVHHCPDTEGHSYFSTSQDIYFDKSSSSRLGTITAYFDNSDIDQAIRDRILINFLTATIFAVAIYLLISFLSRLSRRSLDGVLDEAVGHKKTSPQRRGTFEIIEFEFLRDKLRTLIEATKRSAENETFVRIARQVSHDVRSPLSVLNALAHVGGQIDEDKKVLLRSAAARIDKIANELLERSRPRSEDNASTSLEDIQLLIMEKTAEYKSRPNVSVQLDFSCFTDELMFPIEKVKLGRVLSNLVNNGVEALSDSGLVTVKCTNTETEVEIKISDSGSGISDKNLKRLNADESFSTKDTGNGIGLSHARKVLRDAGGRLHLDSKPGVGASVSLVFPRIN